MLRSWLRLNRIAVTGLTIALAVLVMGGIAIAAEPQVEVEKAVAPDAYPLETCIVSGAKLGSMGEPVVYDYEGREVQFCCAGCVGRFEKDPDAYMEKMNQAIVAAELPNYPLETCVVSGDSLGSMGDPVDHVYDNQLVRFCCSGCIKAFEKQPDKYMAVVDKAREAEAAKRSPRPYPLDTCIVSGGKLGSMGEPVTYVYMGQEIQFCCSGCISRFEKDPEKYMDKLHAIEKDRMGEPGQSR